MFARHVTLVANEVTTITLDKDYDRVEIVNKDGVAEVEGTLNGATPTVGGNDQFYLPTAVGGLEIEVPTSGTTVVKLISSGTPKVYVRGI